MSLKEAIKAEAMRLGFDLIGVTIPDPPSHLAVFQEWLEAGRHGEMSYLATDRNRERRADPRAILPDCRSILVLAMRYPIPEAAGPPAHGLCGRVSCYAWGQDYHDLLAVRLASLVEFIKAQVDQPFTYRWYCDTGPILERELAQRAGLGWIGKNTCLINPRLGSYLFLGEILLGIELEPDSPFVSDQCGSCRRCIEACPTGCILPDRTLDARRCISYLTIELKGPIPTDLRPLLGDWVFGCDICQQVCPWNVRFAVPHARAGWAGEPAFAPQASAAQPELVEGLALSPQDFKVRYRSSPLKRARRCGYLRNLAVALGNRLARAVRLFPHSGVGRSSLRSAIVALRQALLSDPDSLVRAHAAWALGQAAWNLPWSKLAHRALQEAARRETEAVVSAEIDAALETIARLQLDRIHKGG